MNSKQRPIATLTRFFVLALIVASVPALLVGIDVSGHETLDPGSQNPRWPKPTRNSIVSGATQILPGVISTKAFI